MSSDATKIELDGLKKQLSGLQSNSDENGLGVEAMNKQISSLESAIARVEGRMASSWAFHSRDEYEKAIRENSKQEIMGFVTKFVISAVIVLAGAGYLFIKSVVTDVYDNKNKDVISDFQSKLDKLVKQDERRYEWQRFHNYGSDRLHLAEFYLNLPFSEDVRQKIIVRLLKAAESHFNEALRTDPKQGSTYWELAELKYTYPLKRFNLPYLVDEQKAIMNYERAISYYTDDERSKGWKADCYLRLGEIYYSRANAGGEDTKQNSEIAIKDLQEARKEYENSNPSSVTGVADKLSEIDNLLEELTKGKG